MDADKLFYRGPSMAKDRSPNVVLVDGTSSLVADDNDLRPDWRQSSARWAGAVVHAHWSTCGKLWTNTASLNKIHCQIS